MATIADMMVRIGADIRDLDRKLVAASSMIDNVGRSAQATGGMMTRRLTVPIIAGFGASVYAADKLNKSLREVNTLTGETGARAEASFSKMKREVADLSNELGVAQTELSRGLYDTLGAGVPKENAITFLRVATKAAVAGVTDTQVAVDGITTSINAFGLSTKDAQRVSDVLFQTVNYGKATFEELASQMYDVAPTARVAGVSIEQVGGALAQMTAAGTPARVATTQIRQALVSMMKPTDQLKKAYEKLGVDGWDGLLKKSGTMQAAFETLRKTTGGNKEELFKMLGSIEAVQGYLALTGANAKGAADMLTKVSDAAGATDRAFAEIDKARNIDRLKTSVQSLAITTGDTLTPAVLPLVDQLQSLVAWFGQLNPQTQQTIVMMIALAAAIGPVVYVLGSLARAFVMARTAAMMFGTGAAAARTGLLNMVAGFTSSQAAASAFTGKMGTAGGAARTFGQRLVAIGTAGRVAQAGTLLSLGALGLFAGAAIIAGVAIGKVIAAHIRNAQAAERAAAANRATIQSMRDYATVAAEVQGAALDITESALAVERAEKNLAATGWKPGTRATLEVREAMAALARARNTHAQAVEREKSVIAGANKESQKSAAAWSQAAQALRDEIALRNALAAKRKQIASASTSIERQTLQGEASRIYAHLKRLEKVHDDNIATVAEAKRKGWTDSARIAAQGAAHEGRARDAAIASAMGKTKYAYGNGILAAVNHGRSIAAANAPAVGQALGSGVSQGIDSWISGVASKAAQMVNEAIAAAKRAADAHSPSRRAAKEIGEPIAQGVAVGMLRGSRGVQKAAADTVLSAVDFAGEAAAVRMRERGVQIVDAARNAIADANRVLKTGSSTAKEKAAAQKTIKAQQQRIRAGQRLVARANRKYLADDAVNTMTGRFAVAADLARANGALEFAGSGRSAADTRAKLQSDIGAAQSQYANLQKYLNANAKRLTAASKTAIKNQMAGLLDEIADAQEAITQTFEKARQEWLQSIGTTSANRDAWNDLAYSQIGATGSVGHMQGQIANMRAELADLGYFWNRNWSSMSLEMQNTVIARMAELNNGIASTEKAIADLYESMRGEALAALLAVNDLTLAQLDLKDALAGGSTAETTAARTAALQDEYNRLASFLAAGETTLSQAMKVQITQQLAQLAADIKAANKQIVDEATGSASSISQWWKSDLAFGASISGNSTPVGGTNNQVNIEIVVQGGVSQGQAQETAAAIVTALGQQGVTVG